MAQDFVSRIIEVPVSSDGDDGHRHLDELIAHMRESEPALAAILQVPKVTHLVRGVFEGSSYLRALSERDPARLLRILTSVPEKRFAEATEEMRLGLRAAADINSAKRLLRIYKNAPPSVLTSTRPMPRLPKACGCCSAWRWKAASGRQPIL